MLILTILIALILDAIDIAGMGVFSLVIGIPGNILLALIAYFDPDMEKQLSGWLGGALAVECFPIISILPIRTGVLIYLNLNKISKVLGFAEKIAKVAKYVGFEPAIVIEKALHEANTVVNTAETIKSDPRQAFLQSAYREDQELSQENI